MSGHRLTTGRQMTLRNLAATGFVFFAMLNTAPPTNAASLAPELVIINGSIHTMDQARPLSEAVAILGKRIVALGSTDEIRGLAGARTRVIDANGKTVLPGFNDAHVHFMTGGFSL